ncbi:Inclusion body protein [Pseudomonas helmanticensis]|uniref:Inclusion body protein n=1 Tax=Pseudomonas helmanticensis TaxID=1471381 RepID=A0ACD2U5R4_9PSED|nr:AidA/PixA family protein [Pseudomonas helmanticensis]SMQ25865.1 Inclusion body protein [Pseudomonas helmanticensis]
MTSEPIPSPSTGVTSAHNVLLIVDAESILARYPNPSLNAATPTSITDGLIFFAIGNSSKEIVINDSKITVPVQIGQDLHFRGRSVSLIAEHSVVVYRMTAADNSVLSEPSLQVHINLTVPAPNPDDPTAPGNRKADDHFWTCTPKKSGDVQCELSFMLVNQQCEAVGYFHWVADLKITE